MTIEKLKPYVTSVRENSPLVHCITNYVTVNDCANALLAIGASPIMSDEPEDVEDITSICGGLVLNIGTLNKQTIEGMKRAGAQAAKLEHVILLDPVGAGASTLRTDTATNLLDEIPFTVVRGNMSEMKALAGSARRTRGVDVNPYDVVTEENLVESVEFACELAEKLDTVIAITGAIDIIADSKHAFVVRNGVSQMGKITGAGCMLSVITAAYVTANPEMPLQAVAAAVSTMGICGEQAVSRMTELSGTGTFRVYLIDALSNFNEIAFENYAQIEQVK